MKFKFLLIGLFAALVLSACNAENSKESNDAKGNDGINIKEMVQGYSTDSLQAESASITSSQLIVKNDGSEKVYDLPKDAFFVSIAPYVNTTHP
ncbi:hypothetical protein DRW41_07240 [Neobacillus piezotolerans]|uniref:Uncharacterized protein n=2 Tax=Neobacillus piezotolerans TaxID=2259171 RepID=A0A3D8GTU6_9BACI|nr:hypothetical protein DRW41_07240 [Neobacillus piezotolerans]